MTANEDAHFYLWHVALALVIFAMMLLIVDVADLDQRISTLFYDPSIHAFPLRDNWVLEKLEHAAAKMAVMLLWLSVLVVWIATHWFPAFKQLRSILLFIFAGMLLSALSVTALRSMSVKHCPYDLQQYGGTLSESIGLFESTQKMVKPGKCRPSGHASAGFCLFAWYFAARRLKQRRLAVYFLGGTVLFGFFLSMGRVAQGAHFVSHCVWSAIVCWFVTLALYEIMLIRQPTVVARVLSSIPKKYRQVPDSST
jgi:membrane-associated PAP2 superfamily phosphatase